MKTESEPVFKVGDVVVFYRKFGSYDRRKTWGTVEKISDKGTITVRSGKEPYQFRPNKYGKHYDLEIPSKHELAERMWWIRRPKTPDLSVDTGFGWRETYNSLRVSAEASASTDVGRGDGPPSEFGERLRVRGQQLLELAAWWEQRPVLNERDE